MAMHNNIWYEYSECQNYILRIRHICGSLFFICPSKFCNNILTCLENNIIMSSNDAFLCIYKEALVRL